MTDDVRCLRSSTSLCEGTNSEWLCSFQIVMKFAIFQSAGVCDAVRLSRLSAGHVRDKTSPLTQTVQTVTLYSVTRGHNTHLLQQPASDKVFKFWIFSAARQTNSSQKIRHHLCLLPLRLQGQAASLTVFTGLMWSSLVQLLLQHIKVFLRLKGINYFVHLLTTCRSIGIQSERQKSCCRANLHAKEQTAEHARTHRAQVFHPDELWAHTLTLNGALLCTAYIQWAA